eukprot:3648174-Rhodomonas_salina.1
MVATVPSRQSSEIAARPVDWIYGQVARLVEGRGCERVAVRGARGSLACSSKRRGYALVVQTVRRRRLFVFDFAVHWRVGRTERGREWCCVAKSVWDLARGQEGVGHGDVSGTLRRSWPPGRSRSLVAPNAVSVPDICCFSTGNTLFLYRTYRFFSTGQRVARTEQHTLAQRTARARGADLGCRWCLQRIAGARCRWCRADLRLTRCIRPGRGFPWR